MRVQYCASAPDIINGGKADLETPVLLEVRLDTIVRSLHTQGVNRRLTEEKLYGLVYNSIQKA